MQNAERPGKATQSHTKAIYEAYTRHRLRSTKPHQGHTTATPRLPQGHPKATPRLPQGYTKATPRLHQGYTKATPRLHQGLVTGITCWPGALAIMSVVGG
jgi:hypothetical protein